MTFGRRGYFSSYFSNAHLLQRACNSVKRLALRREVAVLVDLLGGRDVGVSEDHLCVPRRHAQVLQRSRCGMTRVMHRDPPQARLLADLVKRPHKVLRIDRRPTVACEDEPRRSAALLFGGMRQDRVQLPDDGKRTVSSSGLYWRELEMRIDALQLRGDLEDAPFQMDVLPREPEHLPPTHAVGKEQQKCAVPRMAARCIQEPNDLVGLPRLD
ncbi:MAG TPA: hypothetical protein VLF38_00290 [Nocardioides sp.]|nr:hypothetical protein [Nocardioides sp.]HSX65948.1 hypothetical protein [Nocardioides sp.]